MSNGVKYNAQHMADLSRQQQEFVRNFMQHGHAGRAAKEAGYSEKSAAQMGGNLKRNPRIKAAIEAERNRDKAQIEWTKKEAFALLSDLRQEASNKGQLATSTKIIELQCKLAGFLDTKDGKGGNTLNISFGGLYKLIDAVKKGKDIEIEAEAEKIEEIKPEETPWIESTSQPEKQS